MRIALFLGLACILATPVPSRADVLVFKNGDRWSGTLLSMEDGKVKFRSALVGRIEVPFARVEMISTEEPVEIEMTDGTVLVDTLAAAEPGMFQTGGESLAGEQVLALAETKAINPEEAAWKGRLLAGAEFERGNTIKDSAYVEFNAGFQSERHRIAVRGSYDAERTTTEQTTPKPAPATGTTTTKVSTTQDRNLFGRLKYDYLFTRRNFWYVATSGEKDGPSDLDLRFIASTGLGRDFFNRPDLKLQIYAGPTFVSEHFTDGSDDEQRAAGTIGWDFLYEIISDLDFFTDGTYTQAGKDDIIVKAQAGLRNDLTKSIFLEAKVLWEYDSEPASDAERQDVDYILGLGYSF